MDILPDLKNKYLNVVRLLEDECNKDPKEEPYRSKYKAKSVLMEMEEIVTKELSISDSTDPQHQQYMAMLVVIFLHLGIISFETEEPSIGENYCMKAYDMITDHLDPKFLISSLNVRNQLGIIWCQRSETLKAQNWLEEAEKLYEDYVRMSPSSYPLTWQEIFDANEDRKETQGTREIEKVHTLTKFYLAQVYGSSKDLLKSAIYCHETLRRQLVHNEYDPIDWALNSATLSQFFMERTLFKQARHHLAAASYVLGKYENSLRDFIGTEEETEYKKEELRHRAADISRCWAKYGIFLLEHSKINLYNEDSEENPESDCENLKNLWFDNLDVSLYENEIVDADVVLFEDARQVFLITQKHIKKAKEYYSLEYHASDHVQIVQDHSQLFKHLTAFEHDEENQCKMIKRRIDLLDAVLKELNPQYYLHCCRQLWFELGECYHDLMHIKLQRIKESKTAPTPHALKKVNFLAEQSIENFSRFLDSIKEKSTNMLPEELDEDLIRPTLIAHFYLGRLYYKIITQDKLMQAEYTKKSYECFRYFVDYCDKSEFARTNLTEELNVCREMMSLLQMKMLQI